jgi:diguanylate cyclase (GGDEF)-like protein
MGGDEFAVALIESEHGAASPFLARLREQVAASDLPAGFSISAGFAHYPSETTEAEELFRLADERLYAAKPAGR